MQMPNRFTRIRTKNGRGGDTLLFGFGELLEIQDMTTKINIIIFLSTYLPKNNISMRNHVNI
jgi:hypothetical protein